MLGEAPSLTQSLLLSDACTTDGTASVWKKSHEDMPVCQQL